MAEAPEGGYGWVIVGCYVINNGCVIQLVQMLGLALKDVFKNLDISDSAGAAAMTTLHALSMGLGVLVGPLIRRFDFRRVAVAGAVLTSAGLALTSTARGVVEIFAYYSGILAVGVGLAYPCYIVAFSSYFRARRTLGMAVTMSLTGAVGTLVPLAVGAASAHYGPQSALLLLAGLALQSLVGAALLRPLPTRHHSHPNKAVVEQTPMLPPESGKHDQPPPPRVPLRASERTAPSFIAGVAALFDLELVRSPAFVSLVLGASLGMVADVNLVVFLPFVLSGRGFSTAESANLLAVFSAADTVCRLAAPLLHRVCGRTSRAMYAATLVALVATRTGLLLCRSHAAVLAAMALTGAGRGVNAVFLQLLIPDNVPLARLPSAQGFYLLTNGVLITVLGSGMSWLLGRTKDYDHVLLVLLALNALAMAIWGAERLLTHRTRRAASKAPTDRPDIATISSSSSP